jgi:hypothetical protein
MLVGVVLCLLVAGGVAAASQDPYRDQAEHVPCPTAPPGWTDPAESAGSRTILTPLTAIVQPEDPTMFFGTPAVQVDCDYRTSSGKNLDVLVRYALPIDLNPWNDFYIGCTVTGHPQSVATAAHAWNDRDRIYRVVGAKTWSLATFIDDLKVLGPSDVPRFEAIANKLLESAQPYAHNCKLAGNGSPVEIRSIWTFSFDATTSDGGVTSSGRTTGSFTTTPDASGGAIGAITNLFADNFPIRVKSGGKTSSLTIHVAGPISFQHRYGSILKAHVVVLASTMPGCVKGSTGTMLLSIQYLSEPRVGVTVCGHTYLNGKGQVTAQMKTV